jgi:hypothetical protein
VADNFGSAQGGLVKMNVTGLTNGVSFKVASAGGPIGNANSLLQASGVFNGTSTGGLAMDLSTLGVGPRNYNGGIGMDLDRFIRSDLLVAPANPGKIDINSLFTTASTKLEEDGVPIQVRIAQPVSFMSPSASAANISYTQPDDDSSPIPESKTDHGIPVSP